VALTDEVHMACPTAAIFSIVILASVSGLLVPIVVIVAALVLLAILLRSA
jgi:hypothetical protein